MKRSTKTVQDMPIEIAITGDLTQREPELTEKLLSLPVGGAATLYINSPGGSPYSALAVATTILLRKLRCVAFVTGECSSAALWPFAACVKRYVTPTSVMLFHAMKWQSEEHIQMSEAAEWARHFGRLEQDLDSLLCDLFGKAREQISTWAKAGKYVSGQELVTAGLAEAIPYTALIANLRQLQAEQQGLSVHKPVRTKQIAH